MQVNTEQNFYPQIRITDEAVFAKFGLTWEKAARIANQHTLAAQRFLSTRSPKAKVFEQNGFVGCLSQIKAPFLNLSLDANYPAHMGEQKLLAEIEALCDFYESHHMQNWWLWLISPFATPKHISSILLKHGFEQDVYQLPCLMASLTDISSWPSIPDNLTIRTARDIGDLKAATHLSLIHI